MALNLGKTVYEFLASRQEEKFTARQMAEWIFKSFPEECRKKQEKSQNKYIANALTAEEKDEALVNAIVAEIGARRPFIQKEHLQIRITEGRPREYYYTDKSDMAEIQNAETNETFEEAKILNFIPKKEHDYYPLVSNYLFSELNVYSKRIDEKRSRNNFGSGGNKWLYPDIVGMEDLSADWDDEIKKCVTEYSSKKTKLWSFEVKVLINRSNVREVFFQTVSNSAWANFAYLVTNVVTGDDTLKELRLLSSLHGVGCILLNAQNISESQILIPAREKTDIDWNAANRLAKENTDFLEYIKSVKQFYQTGEVKSQDWYAA